MQFNHAAWKISAAALIIGCCSFYAYCLPEGENVVAGSASFDRSQADTLAVTTASDRLIVDYHSFNIASQETVRFQQPGPQSVALNRVTGADPSAIFGTLTANGQIFLVNPNGILFAPGSHVDVAGMVASTMDITNEDFLAGRYIFTRTGDPAYIINQGTLAANGGYVCLLAQGVDNRAAIQADLGTVVLAAGEKITLALEDANAISVVVDEAVSEEVFGPDGARMRSAVSNSGTIQAAGGKVILTAKVLNRVFDHAINNTGLINVGSLVEHDGVIELLAEGAGIVNAVSGQIKADSTVASVQAGTVLLQADTILQQGLISANSLEDADGGSVTLISQSSTILDEASRTEAQAAGLLGNGGQIRINAASGNTYVNKLAVIDFSAGSVSGNGGTAHIDAFAQLGFYGILNGRAPPGYAPGKAYLDPETVSIGDVYLQLNSVMYVDAWRDIFITGPIYLGHDAVLELHADSIAYTQGEYTYFSWDTQYDPGIGAIYNSGDFGIYASDTVTSLVLYAGSGIGTLGHPILTNVSALRVVINPEAADAGDVFIEQGSEPLYAEIYAPRSMVVLTCSGPLYSSTDGTAITADELYIEAEGGIGEIGDGIYYPLTVDVNKLVAVNQGYGPIILESDNDLNILALINDAYEGSGDVDVYANGDLTVTYGIRASGYITLTAENDLYLCEFADITGNPSYDIYLTALNGRIGLIPEAGLLGYWNFDQYSSYIVYDQVTGQYAYCSGNPYQVEGGVGGSMAMSFDGAGDYINTGRYFGLGTGDFTLTAWYRGTQSSPYVGIIGATPGMNVGYTLENHQGNARYWLSHETFDSSESISDGSWHQLSMVRENMEGGSEGSLYIIGPRDLESDQFGENVYFEDFPVAQDSVDSSVPFWIGGWGNTGRLTQGSIDEVRVYNRALSGLELYAQTLVAPGTGRLSADYVELEAQTGIDIGFGYVREFYAANVSGDLRIDSIGDLTVYAGDGYSSVDYHGGPISLLSQSDIYINDDISTDGDYDIYISAAGNIEVAEQVSIYSANDYYGNPSANVTTGDVTLNAGGDIIFGRGASVYSNASSTSPVGADTSFARSGNISLTADNNITMDWGRINSHAQADGYGACTAYSGDVVLSAGNALTETGFLDLIFSYAYANAYENPDSSAFASSGLVSLYAGDSMTIDGRDPEYTYGGDVYSYGRAYGGLNAVAYSSSVSLATDYGDISLYRLEVRSDADAQTYTQDTPGTSSEAYARGEGTYTAVSIDAGGSILMNDNTLIYGSATAQGVAASATARSGDVSLDARNTISLASHVYSEALTYADALTQSFSGKVRLDSDYGPVTIPNTALVFSNASSNVIGDAGSAYATSDDVMVRCLYGPVTLNQSVSSTAEAYGDDVISPARVEAVSGDVSVGSGYNYVEYYTEIYGPDYYNYVGYYDPDAYYYGDTLTLNGGYVYSNPRTSNATAADLDFKSGNLTLYGETISLVGASVYTGAESDQDEPLLALNTAYVTAGNIGMYAAGNISLSGSSDITTRALASGPAGDGAMAANAVSGAISLRSEYGDIALGSAAAVVYDLIQSYASVSQAADRSAVSGAVSLFAGNNILLLPSAYNYPVESLAAEGPEARYSGNLSLTAMGDITLSQDLNADTLSILADADWSGYGEIIQNADVLTLNATRFNISGAQEFDIDLADSISVSAPGVSFDLYGPGYSDVLGLSLASSLEDTVTLNDSLSMDDYIRIYSAGDINVYGSLYAGAIELIADYNQDGYGNLFGYIDLTAGSHRLQSAGDITIIENRVYCGEEGFNAYLAAPDGYFGDLDIRSTAGSVTVTTVEGNELSRTGYAGISLRAQGDIVIEAPVSVEYGGLSLISDAGSLVGGIAEGLVHITAASDVYLQAGDWYAGEAPSNMVGSLDAPLAILVSGEGEVSVRVHGQTEGVSGNLTGSVNGSSQADAIAVVNDAPGVVYFNNAPAPEPEEPVVPGPGPGPEPGTETGEEPSLPEVTGQVIANQPEVIDGTALDQFQVSSPMGMLFAYHPLSDADTSAFEQFATVAGDYLLSNGQLQYVGRSNLLPFFEQLDLKRKTPAAL